MKRRYFTLGAVLLASILLSGCALLFHGTKQKVAFTESDPSMVIDAKSNDVICQQTPCVGKVWRSYKDRDIILVGSNGQRRSVKLKTRFDAPFSAMLDVFVLPGLLIDLATASWMGYPKTMGPATPVAQTAPVEEAETGMYAAVIGFNNELHPLPIGPLDSRTQYKYKNFARGLSLNNSTMLYRAVDEAVDMLESYPKPANLSSVTVVTFTDGFDNASHWDEKVKGKYTKAEQYGKDVQARLQSVRIGGVPIDATVIGLPGNDLGEDLSLFKEGLDVLVSGRGKKYMTEKPQDVVARFEDIAKQLNKVNRTVMLKLRVPVLDEGMRIRIVFDEKGTGFNAANSKRYIDAYVVRTDMANDKITLGGIQCKGIKLNLGEAEGRWDAVAKQFAVDFGEVKGMDQSLRAMFSSCALYKRRSSSSTWQRESEFKPNPDENITEEHHSALVVLVLDCSHSLGADFPKIKEAAEQFINLLANPN